MGVDSDEIRRAKLNADSEDALHWHERDARFWAGVTAPWVLVQEIAETP